MKREKRHSQILEQLYLQDSVQVEDLAENFDVSVETIRRDLTTLAERGLLRKVHGGAVRFQTAQEDTFSLRSQVNRAAKQTIGQYATRFINAGDSLFINAGTTTAIFAEYLAGLDNLTVVTNCASVADKVWQDGNSSHKIFLLGGEYNGIDTETHGSLLLQQLELFQVDHTFLTLGAVHAQQGCMEYRVEAAEIIRMMMKQSRTTTVLVDSTKLDKIALAKICDLHEIDRLITEYPVSDRLRTALDRANVDVHISDVDVN